MELASPLKKRNFQLQEEQNNFMLIDFNKINYEQLDANLNLNNKENNNIYERYLEEISKLKTKITNLESKLNQCKFRKTNQDDNLKNESTKTETPLFEYENDIFTYSAFTYDKLYSANSDIYKRNIIKLTGLRKIELRNVVQKSLDFLNSKQKTTTNADTNYTIEQFHIGFTRSTPASTGYEYELYFTHPRTQHCCSQIKIRRALEQNLDLVDLVAPDESNEDQVGGINEPKKLINFILPLSGGSKNERAFRLFLSSFESIVVNDDSGQAAALIIVFQGMSTDFAQFNVLVKEFKQRTKFEAIKFVQEKQANSGGFSRSKAIKLGIDSLNCDPDDCLLFLCDVDVLFDRNFLDLCRSNAVRGKRVFFPILFSFYNPRLLGPKITPESNEMGGEGRDTDELKRTTLIINKETGYWRETGFGMACIHREDFRVVSGFDGYTKGEAWGGEDLYLYRKFVKSSIQVFRSITPGLFHMYHPKECNRTQATQTQYKDCLAAKVYNEASHRDFGLIYFNLTAEEKGK